MRVKPQVNQSAGTYTIYYFEEILMLRNWTMDVGIVALQLL